MNLTSSVLLMNQFMNACFSYFSPPHEFQLCVVTKIGPIEMFIDLFSAVNLTSDKSLLVNSLYEQS